jgi:hypothetical protein
VPLVSENARPPETKAVEIRSLTGIV